MDFPPSTHRRTPFGGDGDDAHGGDDSSENAARTVFAMIADGRPRAFAEMGEAVAPLHPDDPAGAVRGALDALRAAGMQIDVDGSVAVGRRFACLEARAVAERLAATDGSPSDWDVRVAWSCESTNTALLAAVRAGTAGGRPSLWACEIQPGGRGRLGRHWTSAPGASLTMSVAVTIARPLSAIDGATLVCGLAVRDALAEFGVDAALKWPNDVLVDGRKLAGILVEAHAAGGRTTLVVGIGINVVGRPAGGDRGPASPRPISSDAARRRPIATGSLRTSPARSRTNWPRSTRPASRRSRRGGTRSTRSPGSPSR